MDKQKIKLGSIIVIGSIIVMLLLMLLLLRIANLEIVILNIIGPIFMMTFFVGLFILLAGLFHKEKSEEEQ